MEAFGIFEGGGAKGLAHVGALKSAEERHIKFVGVAGASAGAIVAALVAAGYSADELYSPTNEPRGVLERNFLTFFDAKTWEQWVTLKDDVERTFTHQGAIWAWLKSPLFYLKHRSALRRLSTSRGLFNTLEFQKYLNDLLCNKVQKHSGPDNSVTFEDLLIPLKIVASDVASRTIKIFSREETPNRSVASAVAASISIPYFFVPLSIDGSELVDGGLLSNFPAWLFDKERRQEGPHIPTFGFRLVERQQEKNDSTSLMDFSRRLFGTALSGDQLLEIREVENLNTVPLRVSVSTFDFDLAIGDKDRLFEEGLQGGRNFFIREIGPRDPRDMQAMLEVAKGTMQAVLQPMPTGHLRLNVIMPIDKDRLRVLYSLGMDNDPDDRLDFEADSGAAGRCWQTHVEVICDLNDAKSTFASQWKMNKYQQAMVRRELRSLLSVPIFDKNQYDPHRTPLENKIIGILNFDSDDNLLEKFASAEVQTAAKKAANAVSTVLKP